MIPTRPSSARPPAAALALLFLFLLGSAPPRALSQGSTLAPAAPAERVVITAPAPSVLSPDVEEARARLQTVPGAVNVVGPEDYHLGRHDSLEDLLRYQPGLVLQAAQGSEDTHVSNRGSGQDSDNVLGLAILVDGIPINQADGQAYLYDVDLQTVRYAEVYRGADALRYGAATLGGAINLVSLTGRDAPPLAAGVAFGSFGYTQQQAASGWSQGPWDLYAAVTDHTLAGYQAHGQENSQKVTLNLGYQVSDAVENRAYFYYGRLEQNNPAALTKADLFAHPRQTDPEAVEQNWGTRWNYVRLMDRAALRGNGWTLQVSVSWNHRQVTQRQEYEDDFRLGTDRYYSDDYAADVLFESDAEVFGRQNRFSAGVLPAFEPESDSYYENPHGKLGALLFTDRTHYLTLPLFVADQFHLTPRFSLLAGFQAVYVGRMFRDHTRATTLGDQSHDDHFRALNPKAGLAYGWKDNSLIYLNASRSFQPVSFDESLGVQAGTDGGEVFHRLRAQHALTLELGTRGEAGPVTWDVALYRSGVRHELLALNNARGVPLGTVNAEATVHQGMEVGGEVELARSLLFPAGGARADRGKEGKNGPGGGAPTRTDRLVLKGTYGLSDFRFDGDRVYGDRRIAGNAVQAARVEVRYEHPGGFYAGPNVECNVVRYPVDEANTLFADPYALLGFRAGYRGTRGPQVFLEAKNLLAKTYAAYVEPLADARTSAADNAAFHPGGGRAFYGGVSWVW